MGGPSPGKHPLTRRGLHDATTEEDLVRAWWGQWRLANVGLVTGRASGIAVVDIDLPGAAGSIATIAEVLPATLTALTGGGGIHLVYACERSLGNTTGRLHGWRGELPGIDLRADGGYVVAPPSAHGAGSPYSWLNPETTPAPLPEWIVEPVAAVVNRSGTGPAPPFAGDGSPFGLCALRAEIARLGRALKGQRNNELNRAAFNLAQLVAGGELREAPARAALLSGGLKLGLAEREVARTTESGFRAGLSYPRSAPQGGHRRPVRKRDGD